MTALSKRTIVTILVIVIWITKIVRAMNDKNKAIRDGATLVAKAYVIFVIFAMLAVFDVMMATPIWSD